MVKTINYNSAITRKVDNVNYDLTQFIADSTEDITAMNADGSTYLNYPAGSVVLCIGDGNVYVLNASETAYEVPGGAEK